MWLPSKGTRTQGSLRQRLEGTSDRCFGGKQQAALLCWSAKDQQVGQRGCVRELVRLHRGVLGKWHRGGELKELEKEAVGEDWWIGAKVSLQTGRSEVEREGGQRGL